MSRIHYGRLWRSRRTGQWVLSDLDGRTIPIRLGDRVTVGQMYGVQVYATLLPGLEGPQWAVTEIPTTPADGAYASIWADDPDSSSAIQPDATPGAGPSVQ